jgi:F1F0 ATPase subunit 2
MIAGACAIGGVVLGIAYLATLARNVELFTAGRPGAAIALQLGRFTVVAAALSAMAHLGVAPLLAGVGGFVVARILCLRRRR